MSEAPKRRNLFAIALAPAPPPEEAIAAVAVRNGFSQPPAADSTPPSQADQADKRRRRQPTGRVHQFTTRLRQETLDAIYREANDRNIPIAQVIEEAMAALDAQQRRQ